MVNFCHEQKQKKMGAEAKSALQNQPEVNVKHMPLSVLRPTDTEYIAGLEKW